MKDIECIYDEKRLELISRKVSMYSGDIQRSLQITKRAVELCREQHFATKSANDKLTPVTFKHAMAAFDDLFHSKTVQVL